MDNSVGGELAAGYVLSCVKQEWLKKKKKKIPTCSAWSFSASWLAEEGPWVWVEGSLSPPSFSLDSLDKLDSACINTVNLCNLHHALRFVMGPDLKSIYSSYILPVADF